MFPDLPAQSVHAEVRRAAEGGDPTPTARAAIGGSVERSCSRKNGRGRMGGGWDLVICILRIQINVYMSNIFVFFNISIYTYVHSKI